ncbi:MAG: thioredoxin domain-containing protein [Anaerolineales bacterium]|nr:MAG: thioredoxin domain-containing protein [Anaerolineales bacterium]
MIAALAKAGAVLDNPDYLSAAKKAADFIWETLREDQGKLLKRYREGESGLPAHLDDYAFLVWGLIEIYEADFDTGYLKKALDLNQIMLDEFWDHQNEGLFFTAENQSDLIHRNKDIYDGALPSGNSIAANNLIRLGRLTSNPDFEEKTSQIGNSFANQINSVPQGYTQLLTAVLFASNPSVEVVISGNSDAEDTKEMIKQLRRYYSPQQVILLRPDQGDEWLFKLLPTLKLQTQVDGKATAYVCQNFQCSAPTTDPEVMIDLLK